MLKRILVIICSSVQIFSINLQLLDGTTAVLSKSEQRYALFRGIAYAEGVAENLYNSGNVKKTISKEIIDSRQPADEIADSKERVEKFLEEMSESATSKLLSQMFHRAGGQFQLTEAPNNPVRQLTPKNMGEILRIISESKSLPQPKELLNLEFKIETYLEKLGLKKASGSPFKRKDFKPFVSSLIGSLQESNPNNSQASFAPGTTEGILLSYVLKRCNTKADLEDYLEGLTGKKITLSNQEYSADDIKRIVDQGIQLENTEAFGDWLTCAFYQKNYMSALPKITSNTSVIYQAISFADCVETTIRNLCNIATYDGASLGVAPKGITLSSLLQSFYAQEKANMPSEVSNKNVHQAWVDVIEDMPGMAYNRLKITGQNNHLYLPSEYEGFMPIDGTMISEQELKELPTKEFILSGQKFMLPEKTVGDARYLVVPQGMNLSCYEVLPTASNMVVALNNLFDLKLYESTTMFKQSFAQQNFSKICAKLGWDLKTLNIDNTKSATINICKHDSCFAINLHRKNHGYVSVTKDKVGSLVDKSISAATSYQEHPEELSELIPLLENSVSMQQLFDLSGKNSQNFLKLLKNVDVRNPDQCVIIIEQVLNLKLQDSELDSYISRLIVQLPTNDIHYIQSVIKSSEEVSDTIKSSLKRFLDIWVIKNGVNNNNTVDIVMALVRSKMVTLNELMPYLEKVMASRYSYVRAKAFLVIKALVKKKMITLNEVMPFIEKGMASINLEDLSSVFSVIQALLEEKMVTSNEVMPFIEKGMASNDRTNIGPIYVINQSATVRLIQVLVKEKMVTLNEVMPFIEKGMASDFYVQSETLNLIKELVKTKMITSNEVMPYLEKGMANIDPTTHLATLHLIQALVKEKMVTLKEVMPFIKKRSMANNDPYIQNVTLNLIKVLVKEKMITLNEVMPFIEKGMASSDSYVQRNTFDLIKELVETKMLTSNEVIPLLEKGVASDDPYVQQEARTMINQLSLVSRAYLMSRGLLRKTGILSMRHEPYATDIVGRDLERRGMSAKEFGEHYKNYQSQLALSQQQSLKDSGYQVSDLGLQKQKFLEHQQMMQPDLEKFYDQRTEQHIDRQQIPYLNTRLAQQRRFTAKNLLPKPSDVGKVAARNIIK